MRPSVEEQLHGIRSILTDVVARHVDDAYAADVLAGVVATLGVLADGGPDLVPFLRWDTAETSKVLAMVAVQTPAPPDDPIDLGALADHHSALRAQLEDSIPLIRQDPDADRAFVELMKERSARYPFAARDRGRPGAHAAR